MQIPQVPDFVPGTKLYLKLDVSVQDGSYALRKAHMCSTPSVRSFPTVNNIISTVIYFV